MLGTRKLQVFGKKFPTNISCLVRYLCSIHRHTSVCGIQAAGNDSEIAVGKKPHMFPLKVNCL